MQQELDMGNKLFKILFLFFNCLILNQASAQTGIGTTAPSVKLHIKSNGPILRLEGSDHAYLELFPQGNTNRFAYFGYPNAASTQLTMMNQNTSGSLVLGTNNTTRLTIDNSGNTSVTGNLTGGNAATSKLSGFVSNISTEGTSRTIAVGDNGMILKCTTSITLTLPATGIPEGFNCMVLQNGTGQVTFSGTFSNRNSFTKTAGQYAITTILYIGGVYIVSGEMSN
jgi:hypothetical protein